MKNRRGIIGAIFLVILVVLFLIGAFFYYQIKSNGLTLSTGKLVVNIGYNESYGQGNKLDANNSEEDEQNITETNITLEDNFLYDESVILYENMENETIN
mgnify:FL=1